MRALSKVVALNLVVVALGACDEAPAPGASEGLESRKHHPNAPTMNSADLNGITLNGITLNGITLNGITLNGITLNGITLNGITLNGTSFHGTQVINGQEIPVGAVDFVGAEFRLETPDNLYVLHFDDIYLDPQNPTGDVYLYDISVHDTGKGVTRPLCQLNGQPTHAIPIANLWDPLTGDRIDNPDALTFACTGAVLAKCINWGFRPWATGTRCDAQGQNCAEVSLADYHQACTRMARADYCGDGTPHTLTGTLIDVFDSLSPHIQAPTELSNPAWGVEAEWGPDGAVCIGTSLRLQILEDNNIQYDIPPCLDALDDLPDCGSFPDSRPSLVGDAYCEAWGTNATECS